MVRISEPLWATGNVVVMDSGLLCSGRAYFDGQKGRIWASVELINDGTGRRGCRQRR